MYDIRYEPGDRMLFVTLAGLWTIDEAQRFGVDIRANIRSAAAQHRNFGILSDSSAFPVQTAQVSVALGESMAICEQMMTGRRAVVVGGVLNKLQAERTLPQSSTRVFLSIEEARRWLVAGDEA